MKKTILLTVLIAIFASVAFSQVAINETGADPDPSAILDLSSTDKGFLVPRVSTTERNAIGTTQSGLLVYDIDTESFWYYNNMLASWVEISGDGDDGDWIVSGNNMYSSVSGNVGIGTTNPSQKLQVRNGNLHLISQNDDAYIKLSSDEEQDITPAYIWSENAKGFSVGSTPGTPQLLVNAASGNVGIGTINPNQKLSIRDGNLSLSAEGSDPFIYLGSNELANSIHSYIWTEDEVGFAVGKTHGTPQLVVEHNSGNVGIGTTDPGAELEVAGQIKLTGGTPGTGKVLTSDDTGLASWQDVPAGVTQINDLTDAKSDYYSVFVGYGSGGNDDGNSNNNSSLGASSMFSNTSGKDNAALGKASLYFNTIGSGNVAVGRSALYKNETGFSNVAQGIHSLYNNVDRSNLVAIGDSSLFNNGIGATMSTHGSENTAVGSKSLFNNTLGNQNTAVGTESLKANTIGKDNTAIGAYALDNNIEGDNNTAVGAFALTFNTTGTYNTTVGYKSLYNHTSGDFNTAFGGLAMYSNLTGTHNTALGYTSLFLNTTGSRNTALGVKALYNNTTGTNNLAIGNFALYKNDTTHNNIAIGDSSLYNNGTGSSTIWESVNNIAIGLSALKANTLGYFNIGIGDKALYNNTTGQYNIAIGPFSLGSNISGMGNISLGDNALNHNTSGYFNIAMGTYSMILNTEGSYNLAIGKHSLSDNIEGGYNTAIGVESLSGMDDGDGNTALGYGALTFLENGDQNTGIGDNSGPYYGNGLTITNSTAIGAYSTITASDQVRIGNSYVTSIGGEVGWTTLSDGRFKNNVKENVLGLDFILKLRPVSYQVDKDGLQQFLGVKNHEQKEGGEKTKSIESGFIAQEVETTVQELGFEFSGIDAPKNDKDYYGLRYGQFVVPLVKGMQEQQKQIETIKAENAELKARLEKLENILNQK
jgi:trimeric autotransporter adhesin